MITPTYIESLKALEKAGNALENASYNLRGGFITATANRTYYACYYCMIALLFTQNIYPKTHQGVRAKFVELFIKTSILPVETSDSITMIFDFRQKADYDLDEDISKEDASNLINNATLFYQLVMIQFQKIINNSK